MKTLVSNALFLSFSASLRGNLLPWQSPPLAVIGEKKITASQTASGLLLVMTEKGVQYGC